MHQPSKRRKRGGQGRHQRLLKDVAVRNAHPEADKIEDITLDVPLVKGKVWVGLRWYLYIRYPQDANRLIKPRKLGKVLRMLARDRRVRDLCVMGQYLK